MNNESSSHTNHIVPLSAYLGVTGALFTLTIVTVWVAQIDLGGWNVVVALLVAAVKSTLVALIFMHLLYDKKLFLIILLTSILFLAIFIAFTMFDTMHRDDLYKITADPINESAVIYNQADSTLDTAAAVIDTSSVDNKEHIEQTGH